MSVEVIWHDLECHSYAADLPLWRALAEREGGPVLDVGAGTGRVALDLAQAGHEVVALDVDPHLIAVLRERAGERGLSVDAAVAEAEAFDLGAARFALAVVPMQTVQLLGDRAAFLACARRALRSGGLLAMAIAEDLVAFEPDGSPLPAPEVAERDGWRYVSQPTAVRLDGGVSRIERVRITETPDGDRRAEANLIELASVDAAGLALEGREAGFTPVPGARILPTDDHLGSAVVMLRA